MDEKAARPSMLYYGDNLAILRDRDYFPSESVDLVYLDPPFNSNQDYNVLFADQDGSRSPAQIQAFTDTWRWDASARSTFDETIEQGGKAAEALGAFRSMVGESDMLAYLSMMAPRLVELRRVLKLTGSIYLHCDPTASHYLKILLDAVFGPENLRNEIVWKRAQPKSHAVQRFPRTHDIILSYGRSSEARFYPVFHEHDPRYVERFYRFTDESNGRRYQLGDLTNPNPNRPNLTYEFPPGSGTVRVWRWTKDRMMKALQDGVVVVPPGGGIPRLKRYLDDTEGTLVTDVWDDIEHLHGSDAERLGYPTQKPLPLLERIIESGSRRGDTVLDPFCAAARPWQLRRSSADDGLALT